MVHEFPSSLTSLTPRATSLSPCLLSCLSQLVLVDGKHSMSYSREATSQGYRGARVTWSMSDQIPSPLKKNVSILFPYIMFYINNAIVYFFFFTF